MKIHYFTLTPRSRSHKMLPSTLDFTWPMYQQNVMLLHPMVKEKMHLQENTLFDLDLGVKVTQNVAQYPRHMWPMRQQSLILLHPKVKKKIHLQENTLFDLDLRVKVTRNVAQCPLHHMTYAPTEFEVTTSKALGGEAFTRKFNIWPWPWGQGHMKCCPVPSTSCDLFSYKVWSCYVRRFMRKCIYKKIQYLTLTLGSRSHEISSSTLYIMWPIHLQSLKLLPLTV